MGSIVMFEPPVWGIDKEAHQDSAKMAEALAAFEFGNVSRGLLLYRDRKLAEAAGKAFGYEVIVLIDERVLLELALAAHIYLGNEVVAFDCLPEQGHAPQFIRARDFLTGLRAPG